MRRIPFALAAAVLAVAAPSAVAVKVAAPTLPPFQRALTSEVVVVGKVAAIEEEAVEAAPAPGVKEKVKYRIGVIKVESALSGAKGLTHLKVGFVPPPEGNAQTTPPAAQPLPPGGAIRLVRPPGRVPFRQPTLAKDQEGVFFLRKHPTQAFYVMTVQAPPLDAKGEGFREQVERIKAALAATTDPMKALKAAKPEDRFLAAAALVTKYRTYPANGGKVEQVPVSKEETQLIIQALLERDWKQIDPNSPQAMQVMFQLGMSPADGWKVPPFNGQGNYHEFLKDVFAKWAKADGAKFTIKRFEAKP